jgi:hypothetical protein
MAEENKTPHAKAMEKAKGEGDPIVGEAVPVIRCRKMKVGAMRLLSACQKCDEYGGMDEVSPAQNGRPAYFQIICKLPTRVDMLYLIKEADEG